MSILDSKVHVLLVEDDEVDIQNVQRAFQKHNVNNPLLVARNGAEALDMLYGSNGQTKLDPLPKIILLDLNMPKVNGIEFLRKLRQDPSFNSVLVFVLTTSNEEKDKIAAYHLNVAGYILKPVQFQDFLETVSILNLYWALLEFPK